ncbi:MAG: Mrp/NBP35 family ATP-binding protein [Syntrophomonadaceae bacterium]|nr:Mrp/NBP35 family ATP-binding protein [Syntrophomonadaceae bacterium]
MGSLNQIKKVVAVMSGKGGVGKSTVTSLLAVGLNRMGYKVGVLDSDITGPSIPRIFGIEGGNLKATDFGIIPPQTGSGIKIISVNLFLPGEDEPVIWRGPLLAGMVRQFWEETDWRELDYLLVDLPPGTGDVPLTVMQSLPVDGIVMVSAPQELVLMVVKKAVKMANKLGVPILGLIENMSYACCPHCNERLELFGPSHAQEAAAQMNIPLFGQLPWNPQLNRLMDQGKIEDYKGDEVTRLSEELVKRLPLEKP